MWSFPKYEPHVIYSFACSMNTAGYACLKGAIPPQLLTDLQTYVSKLADRHNGRYFAYHEKSEFQDSILAKLTDDENFLIFLDTLYRYAAGTPPDSREILPVLRCVQGESGIRESNSFHFDASLVTILIPILIPQEGNLTGDLILFPNLRKIRSTAIVNFVEKLALQNRVSRSLITWMIKREWLTPIKLRMVPGNIYTFWGYRSLHANEACDPATRRVTALFHFCDPHSSSVITKQILRRNQERARIASIR